MNPKEQIGLGWIVAMISLAIVLIVGVALYLRMSAPLREQPRHACLPQLGITITERVMRSIT